MAINETDTMRPLDVMRKEFPQLFTEGAEMVFDKSAKDIVSGLKDQSKDFKSLIKAMEGAKKGVFATDTRAGGLIAKENLKYISDALSTAETSREEKTVLNRMYSELKEVNNSLLENEFSLRTAFNESLKSNLPSLAGILGTIGLDNPAFLFIGSMIQSIADKRKEARKAQEALMKDHQKEILKQRLDTSDEDKKLSNKQIDTTADILDEDKQLSKKTDQQISLAEDNNILLDHISLMINSMLTDGQASRFADIERQRESTRREEALIDAVSSLDGKITETARGREAGKAGLSGDFLGNIGELYNSIMLSVIAAKGFVMKSGKALFRVAKRFAGPIGLLFTAVEFFQGASKGWHDAADKLGKESASTSDKFASAIGGGLGAVVGVADSILGLFGIETHIGEFVDQKTTELLAFGFDSIKTFKDKAVGLFTSISDFIGQKSPEILNHAMIMIDNFKNSAINFFENLFDIAFPEGFSLSEMILVPLRMTRAWVQALFNFDLPEIPSVDQMIMNAKMWVQSLFSFDLPEIPSVDQMIMNAKMWVQSLFSFDLPEIPNVSKMATDGVNKLTGIVQDIFNSLYNAFKNFSVTDLIFGKKSIPIPSEIAKGKTVDALIDEGVIDRKIIGKSTIEDWKRVSELQAQQIQDIIDIKDFNAVTQQRLLDLKRESEKRVPLVEIQPRMITQDMNTQLLNQAGINKEKAAVQASANIVNAPSSTRVNNVSNVSNVQQTNVRPVDNDITFQMMQSMMGY